MDSEKNFKGQNDEIEIDLRAFFLKLKTKWMQCILAFLLGTILALGYSIFLTKPEYQSTALVYLRGNSSTISIQDLQIGSQLSKDYEIIFKSRPILERVCTTIQSNGYSGTEKEMAEDLTVSTLKNMITITNTDDTRILQIQVVAGSPKIAADIANEVMEYGMDSVSEINAQQPYVVENAIQNPVRLGMSRSKMALLGGLAGLVLMIGVTFLRFVLSDNITSVEDLENALDLPVLAVVLEDSNLDFKKSRREDEKHGK